MLLLFNCMIEFKISYFCQLNSVDSAILLFDKIRNHIIEYYYIGVALYLKPLIQILYNLNLYLSRSIIYINILSTTNTITLYKYSLCDIIFISSF